MVPPHGLISELALFCSFCSCPDKSNLPHVLMACRGRKQLGSCSKSPNNDLDHLALKYMALCKMDSSSESESEVRSSDTSAMECGSSAAETKSGPRSRPQQPKASPGHVCYSRFSDPYDGSSEDSDASLNELSRRRIREILKSTICCCCEARIRREPHPPHAPPPYLPYSVSMETLPSTPPSGRPPPDLDSETDVADDSAIGVEEESDPKPGSSHMRAETSSETSPSPSKLHKRKLCLSAGAEPMDLSQKKPRPSELSMEVDAETQL